MTADELELLRSHASMWHQRACEAVPGSRGHAEAQAQRVMASKAVEVAIANRERAKDGKLRRLLAWWLRNDESGCDCPEIEFSGAPDLCLHCETKYLLSCQNCDGGIAFPDVIEEPPHDGPIPTEPCKLCDASGWQADVRDVFVPKKKAAAS